MKPEYEAWTQEFLATTCTKTGYGDCKEAATKMAAAFPELRVVKGHVIVPHPWGRRGHWWCETEDGTKVDPTAGQFPAIYEYQPWKPGDEVRVGKCMECGDEIWKSLQTLDPPPKQECVCSPECEEALMKEYGR